MKKTHIFLLSFAALAAIAAVFYPTRERRIKYELSELNGGAPVSLVSINPAFSTTPDSLEYFAAFDKYSRYTDTLKTFIGRAAIMTEASLRDTLAKYASIAEAARAGFESTKPVPGFLLCKYTANGDTLTAVLDPSLWPVWPR